MTRSPSPGQRHDSDLLPFQVRNLAVTRSLSPALGYDSESESGFETVIPFQISLFLLFASTSSNFRFALRAHALAIALAKPLLAPLSSSSSLRHYTNHTHST
jgi:hypothetical protein